MKKFLEFEKHIAELSEKIEELGNVQNESAVDITKEIFLENVDEIYNVLIYTLF